MKKFFILFFLATFLSVNNLAFASEDIGEEDSIEPGNPEIVQLYDMGRSSQWHLEIVDTVKDFSFRQDDAITVAVLDTGVSRVNGLSCVNFVNEYNAINKSSEFGSATDDNGHGTKVTLLIAACEGGPYGKGIASGINIMPVKVLNNYGWGTFSWIEDGIYWAVENGADVINMSLGAYCSRSWSDGCRISYVDQAIEYAVSNNVAVIVSSGNSGTNYVAYPANHPQAIAVGSVEDYYKKDTSITKIVGSEFSNRGESLDFVAPGIIYGMGGGTSFSAPQVAGAYAVFKNDNPESPISTPGPLLVRSHCPKI